MADLLRSARELGYKPYPMRRPSMEFIDNQGRRWTQAALGGVIYQCRDPKAFAAQLEQLAALFHKNDVAKRYLRDAITQMLRMRPQWQLRVTRRGDVTGFPQGRVVSLNPDTIADTQAATDVPDTANNAGTPYDPNRLRQGRPYYLRNEGEPIRVRRPIVRERERPQRIVRDTTLVNGRAEHREDAE